MDEQRREKLWQHRTVVQARLWHNYTSRNSLVSLSCFFEFLRGVFPSMKREAFSRYVFVSIVASSIEEIMLNGAIVHFSPSVRTQGRHVLGTVTIKLLRSGIRCEVFIVATTQLLTGKRCSNLSCERRSSKAVFPQDRSPSKTIFKSTFLAIQSQCLLQLLMSCERSN